MNLFELITSNFPLIGYFATADNASAGNFGLLDQVQALRWVRENIRSFNGNPDSITLFGAGDAGAASAGLLAMSPLSRHWVKRVIAPGGAAVAPWAVHTTHTLIKNNSLVAAFKYGCQNLEFCQTGRVSLFPELLRPFRRIRFSRRWMATLGSGSRLRDTAARRPITSFPSRRCSFLRTFSFPSDFSYLTGLARDESAAMLLSDPEFIAKGFNVDSKSFEDRIQSMVKIMNGTLNQDGFKSALRFMYTPFTDPGNESLIRDGLVQVRITNSSRFLFTNSSRFLFTNSSRFLFTNFSRFLFTNFSRFRTMS